MSVEVEKSNKINVQEKIEKSAMYAREMNMYRDR